MEIEINDKTIKLPSKLYKDVILSYAATIHKSQGSEFPVVIISLSQYPYNMLNRNLLYTAVTRARDKVYLISEKDALEIAINKEAINARKTSLKRKISEKL
jgi:exodeoxyribonuclease V alpha subunit